VRRILASLFVISAVIGVGVFATGAYFTDTVSTTNQVFTTGTADLKFGQCGVAGTNCVGTEATYDTLDMTGIVQKTGPDHDNSGCMVIENKGDYDLTLTSTVSYTTSNADFAAYFQLAANQADSSCNAGSSILGWTPAATAAGNSPFPFGSVLPVGGRMYVMLYNRWNSADPQDYLQGQWLNLKLQVDGKTN
jgi:hypothetical protein